MDRTLAARIWLGWCGSPLDDAQRYYCHLASPFDLVSYTYERNATSWRDASCVLSGSVLRSARDVPADPLPQAGLLSVTGARLDFGVLSSQYSVRLVRPGLGNVALDRDLDGTSTLFMGQSEDDVELHGQ